TEFTLELESMVQATLDIAPTLKVVLISRWLPGNSTLPVLQLRPLDEPDCAKYIQNHSDGGSDLLDRRITETLYAKSGGIPAHLDRMLRELQTMSLDEVSDVEQEGSFSPS